MKRKTFDRLVSAGGVLVTIALLVAGGLLMWGASFANSTVHDQLAQQKIYFPPASAFQHAAPGTEITPSMIPSVSQYAGQQVLTGPQAETYANDFISVHLSELPMNGVYSQLSTASRANPTNTALAKAEATSFQGTTLRGLLLEAYGFWTFGQIAFWAAIASFVLAGALSVLIGFGFWHASKVSAEVEIFGRRREPVAVAA